MNRERIVCLFFAITIFCELFLALYVYKGSSIETALQLPFENEINIQAFMPEGWGFFSKNPREAQFYIYQKKDRKWRNLTRPNSDYKNFFGLNRKSRAIGVEYGQLLQQTAMDVTRWDSCASKNTRKCLKKIKVKTTTESKILNPVLCDTIGIVRKKIVPWAWAKEKTKIEMPKEALKILVNC